MHLVTQNRRRRRWEEFEKGGNILLRNMDISLQDYTVSRCIRPQFEGCFTLRMKPLRYFETSVKILQSTKRNIAEGFTLRQQCSEKVESRHCNEIIWCCKSTGVLISPLPDSTEKTIERSPFFF